MAYIRDIKNNRYEDPMQFWHSSKEDRLKAAIADGNTANAQALLDDGADLPAVLKKNDMLLADALRKNAGGMVELCLKSGKMDMTSTAVTNALIEIASIDYWRKKWPLYHTKARDRLLYWVDRFSEAGATFDGVDNNGMNMFHVLAKPYTQRKSLWNETEMGTLKTILEKIPAESRPVVLSAKDKQVGTVLHYVLQTANFDGDAERVVRLLLKSGADITIRGAKGLTPLDIAFKRNLLNIVALLQTHHTPKLEKTVKLRTPEKTPDRPPVVPEQVKAVSPPLPASASAPMVAQNESFLWVRVSDEQVASIQTIAALGYKLTDIFNFETRERVSFSQNLETRTETRETRRFDELHESVIEKAFNAYVVSGGKVAREKVFGKNLSL